MFSPKSCIKWISLLTFMLLWTIVGTTTVDCWNLISVSFKIYWSSMRIYFCGLTVDRYVIIVDCWVCNNQNFDCCAQINCPTDIFDNSLWIVTTIEQRLTVVLFMVDRWNSIKGVNCSCYSHIQNLSYLHHFSFYLSKKRNP